MGVKTELLRALNELAAVDREAFRELRADAWAMVVKNHQRKSPEQIAKWLRESS